MEKSSKLNSTVRHEAENVSRLSYILSSRVRLARNIRSYSFPSAASAEERQEIANLLCQIVRTDPRFSDATLLALDDLTPLKRKMLAEDKLISHRFANQGSSRILVMQKAARTSMLVNEEDHLRIQSFCAGLRLQDAWQRAQQVEQWIGEHLDFAYTAHDGYATTCPSNRGLGVRASVLLFLPGLIMLKRITPVIRQVLAAGCTCRGGYGEGSDSQGFLLQISNQQSQEREVCCLLETVRTICRRLIFQEQRARRDLLRSAASKVHQRLNHTYAYLRTAYALDVSTGMQMLGLYRLGVSLGIVPVSAPLRQQLQRIDRLSILIQPAHIRQYALRYAHTAQEQGISADQPDVLRARLMKRSLGFDQ